MPTVNLLLRSAGRGDETRLWDFYRSTLTETLPVPSVGTIRGSLQRGTLLIAEDVGSGNIVATAGYFEYIKSVDGHLVFELAGTRVTTGKLLPFSLQQILLAVRLFQIAATEDQSARPVSIISSARHKRSKENLVCAGMSEIAAMPHWMDYDTYSWAQPSYHAEWSHYIADCRCIERAIIVLQQVGFEAGTHRCECIRRKGDGTDECINVDLTYQIPIRALFRPLLDAQSRGETICALSALPETL